LPEAELSPGQRELSFGLAPEPAGQLFIDDVGGDTGLAGRRLGLDGCLVAVFEIAARDAPGCSG
jgi:hypothetical protein